MKKVFSLFAALILSVAMFAAEGDIVGKLAGILTGGTPNPAVALTNSDNRGGFIVLDDGVYFCNNTTGFMLKAPLDLSSAPTPETDSIGKGVCMDQDAAGHIVIYEWTVGSSAIAPAQIYDANYNLIRIDTLLLNGRCDMPTLYGDLTQGRAAFFTACNSANSVLRHNIVDGVYTSIDTIPAPLTHNGNSTVSALDVDHFYVQSRGNGLYYVDMSGDAPVVTSLNDYFGANTFTSTSAGIAFKMAGHTLYLMGTYKVGGYKGTFAIYDVTDPSNVYVVAEEKTNCGTGANFSTSSACFRLSVDENGVAHFYEYCAFGVRKFDLTVVPAVYMKQNAEGEEWKLMEAGENNTFSQKGIYAGQDILVNSDAADEGATTFGAANTTFNPATIVAKDTVEFVYDKTAGTLTVNLLGKFVPCIDFAVVVPEGTPNCYVVGSFNNWAGFERMIQLDETHYKYKYIGTAALTENVQYKYTCGTDWAYVEKDANGGEIANRTWTESDTVATWASVPVVNVVAYELNGGVTNDYGWKTKGEILLDLQADYNTTYGASHEWAKMEGGIVYYNMNGTWMTETAAQGQACTIGGFVQATTYNTTERLKTLITTTMADKYGWLANVIAAAREAGGLEGDLSENIYRKEVSAFFLNSDPETSWPASPSYAAMGTLDGFQRIWKHGFDNPATVTDPFTLNRPYKAGYTFDGWYAEADFSGEKVLSIDANTTGTLYAKWIEYIPTLAEIVAMAENEVTKAQGVVTYINGRNAYIQDASAGMLLYMKANPTFQVGQLVVVSGTRTVYGGAPELKDVEEDRAEAGTMPAPKALATLSVLKADPLKYFGQLVSFKGLNIVAYDSYKNPSLSDGVDTIACYKMSLDDTAMPVGTKVDVTAIAGYFNGVQLVGDVAGIVEVGGAGKDNFAYPAYGENGEYTLTNKWLFSNNLDNFASNMPAPTDFARGMVAKDGKMYFINRNNASFTVVNGANGKMLEPIAITGDHLFQTEMVVDSATGATEWKDCATLKFNDVKLDQAGHFLIGGCVSGGNRMQIYKVDITTGEATVVVDDRLYDYPDFELEGKATAWRFDAFNVYGDVDNHAIIMAADANSFYVYKWEIIDGVAGEAEQIDCQPLSTDISLIVKDGETTVTAFGTAPQIFPVDFDYFYVDGWNTLPMLYDMDGSLVQDFATVPTGVEVAMPGDTCKMNTGHNGLCEFQVGEEYYLLMAATNTVGSPTSAFALYKFADENKEFSEMTPMWFFPQAGMGAATNGCRTAVPTVEVKDNVATLYVYTNNNGYGVYEMTGVLEKDAIEHVGEDVVTNTIKRIENGNLYIIRNGIRYNAQGVVAE